MVVLYFTNENVSDKLLIPSIIEKSGDSVVITTQKPILEYVQDKNIEFIVCDRPRSLISKDILDILPNAVINIHPSFLPYNKGYHPNYWSFITETPSGTTIHYVDSGIDTGKIIAQTRVTVEPGDTLHTTYNRLRNLSVALFQTLWPEIRNKRFVGITQKRISNDFTRYKKQSVKN